MGAARDGERRKAEARIRRKMRFIGRLPGCGESYHWKRKELRITTEVAEGPRRERGILIGTGEFEREAERRRADLKVGHNGLRERLFPGALEATEEEEFA